MFHLSSIGCALVLQKDLEYWGIDELMMEPCCALKYYPEIEICVNEKQVRIYTIDRVIMQGSVGVGLIVIEFFPCCVICSGKANGLFGTDPIN